MKLFSKREGNSGEPKMNTIAKVIETNYKRVQTYWVKGMIKLTKNFSRSNWWVLLAIFVLSIGTYSIYVSVDAFTAKPNPSFVIIPIRKLKHGTETGELPNQGTRISEEEYNRINRFQLYMDSLAGSPSGRKRYDSINSVRPGLMDSLRIAENYFKRLKQK